MPRCRHLDSVPHSQEKNKNQIVPYHCYVCAFFFKGSETIKEELRWLPVKDVTNGPACEMACEM